MILWHGVSAGAPLTSTGDKTAMDKVIITTFTDPMMGLSYETEPVFRQLEIHFGGRIEFKYNMSLLVDDVYRFTNPDDLNVSKEYALSRYLPELARIYEQEEAISGMPVNMQNFKLFSTEYTSSEPLNLAYKAAQLTDKSTADLFLYNLRFATIAECLPTTHLEEIIKVVRKTKIDEEKFLHYYQNGEAKAALIKDLEHTRELQIYTLPAYLITYRDKSVLVKRLIGYETFVQIIDELTKGKIKPEKPEKTLDNSKELIDKHPLISPIEIKTAFDFKNLDEVKDFIEPLIKQGFITIIEVYHGWFIKKLEK